MVQGERGFRSVQAWGWQMLEKSCRKTCATWGGQNGGVSGPRASPCPHGEAQMANPPLLPWRGPDCRSLPCPRLLGPGRTQRDGIAGCASSHSA